MLATISQIFQSVELDIKTRVLLENEIIGQMSISAKEAQKKKMVSIDNIVYKTFTKKFNREYSNELLDRTKRTPFQVSFFLCR